jgi:hypothetical protein
MITSKDIVIPISIRINKEFKKTYNIPYDFITGEIEIGDLYYYLIHFMVGREENILQLKAKLKEKDNED